MQPAAAQPLPALSAASARDSEAQLIELMRRLAEAPERRATFREEKRLAAVEGPLLSNGTLTYRRPGYLEKLTLFPQRERLVVDGDRLVITPGEEAPRVVDLRGQPELRALVDAIRAPILGDLATLRRGFEITLEAAPPGWRLLLTPRDPAVARVVRAVRVGIAGLEIVSIQVVEGSGDEQLMLIEPAP